MLVINMRPPFSEYFIASKIVLWLILINILSSKKSNVFWNTTPCSPLKVNRRFGGTYRLHLQREIISRTRNQLVAACHLLSRWCLARIILRLWRWGRYVPPKRRLAFNGLHCGMSQKIVLFITTAVITSNPTYSSTFFLSFNCFYIIRPQESDQGS
jgi:hypothetical protein